MTITPLADLIQATADSLFMPWIVIVLLGTGLWLTIRTGVVQLPSAMTFGCFVSSISSLAGMPSSSSA